MLKLDPALLEKNRHSEISSYLVAADEIEKSLAANRQELSRLARFLQEQAPDRILLLGSGASWVTLYTGYYFLQTCTAIPVAHRDGPEFLADEPADKTRGKTVAILASYSGNTADTVNAALACRKRGIPTIAIVGRGVADETGISVNDPLTIQGWSVDTESRIALLQILIKKRKAGFVESGIQLGSYLEVDYFL